jgi:hypothetical protein
LVLAVGLVCAVAGSVLSAAAVLEADMASVAEVVSTESVRPRYSTGVTPIPVPTGFVPVGTPVITYVRNPCYPLTGWEVVLALNCDHMTIPHATDGES